jgi:hypothetical protein
MTHLIKNIHVFTDKINLHLQYKTVNNITIIYTEIKITLS